MKSSVLFSACVLTVTVALFSVAFSLEQAAPLAVRNLVTRITPGLSSNFQLGINTKLEGFRIEAINGQVAITGGSVNELAAGYGYYLRNILGLHWSWNGNRLAPRTPLILPQEPIQISTPWKWRYAYNYCTLSYTMAFWGQKEWREELDRLALSGINIALVQAGLEKVWQLTLRDLGYPEDKIKAYIPNPASAAWWNMGNLEGLGGPLSQQMIDQEAELGKFIVQTMKSLGITPVLQGFVGLVPHDLDTILHGEGGRYIQQGQWIGYTRPAVLDPTCPAFQKVARIWYKNLKDVYGITPQALGGDLFHEGGNTGGIRLSQAASTVQSTMQTHCPGSVWLIMAWGGNPKKDLVNGLDPNHVLVLALDRDMSQPFQERPSQNYRDLPWMWTELLNFGGNHGMYGSLKKLANLDKMKISPSMRNNLQGIGIISEGLETNPIFYDFLIQRFWMPANQSISARNIEQWLVSYATRRYGQAPQEIIQALTLLEQSVYSPVREQEGCTESILCARPARNVQKASSWSSGTIYYDTMEVIEAARLYLAAADKYPLLLKQPTFQYDLIDVVRQMLSDMARPLLAEIVEAFDSRQVDRFNAKSQLFMDLISETDAILATYSQWRFGSLYEQALAKGQTKAEKSNMAEACKRLVSTWTGTISPLNDYSNRQLAGLMKDFYGKRWQLFFDTCRDALQGKIEPDQFQQVFLDKVHAFEIDWPRQTTTYTATPEGHVAPTVQRVFSRMEPEAIRLSELSKQRLNAPKWSLKNTPNTFTFNVTDSIVSPGDYQATFQWESGPNALIIQKVSLWEGNRLISEDVHPGWTGIENKQNTYTLHVNKLRTNLDVYTIKADVKGANGNDSNGYFIFSLKKEK